MAKERLDIALDDRVYADVLVLCARRNITPDQLVSDYLKTLVEGQVSEDKAD